MQRWKHRPEGSNWGDFGPDDQLGRLNLITEEQVLKGAREIRAGKTFCLSLPLDLPGGNAQPAPPSAAAEPDAAARHALPELPAAQRQSRRAGRAERRPGAAVHAVLDTMGRAGPRRRACSTPTASGRPELRYNGYAAGVDVIGPADGSHAGCGCDSGGPSAALKLGIEHLAQKGMQGRGVLVDLERHYGAGRTLIGHAELMRVIEADGIEIEPGDMLVLRTGYAEAVVAMNGQPDADTLHSYGAAGRHRRGAAAVDHRQRHRRHLRR